MKIYEILKSWKYKNTALLILSMMLCVILADTPLVKSFIAVLGQAGYAGVFLVGIFFVSTFTVTPSLIVLTYLAGTLDPLWLAVVAGAGAVAGDFLIFRYLQDHVFEELKPLLLRFRKPSLESVYKTPYFAWLIPALGAVIIASPLPDELGIALMSAVRMKSWQFILFSYALNTLGILVIISIAKFI